MPAKQTVRTCKKGHQYKKSSDCPVCPKCELYKPKASTLIPGLSAPARRALLNEGIFTLKTLANYTENELLALHGIGPKAIPVIKKELKKSGLKLNF